MARQPCAGGAPPGLRGARLCPPSRRGSSLGGRGCTRQGEGPLPWNTAAPGSPHDAQPLLDVSTVQTGAAPVPHRGSTRAACPTVAPGSCSGSSGGWRFHFGATAGSPLPPSLPPSRMLSHSRDCVPETGLRARRRSSRERVCAVILVCPPSQWRGVRKRGPRQSRVVPKTCTAVSSGPSCLPARRVRAHLAPVGPILPVQLHASRCQHTSWKTPFPGASGLLRRTGPQRPVLPLLCLILLP